MNSFQHVSAILSLAGAMLASGSLAQAQTNSAAVTVGTDLVKPIKLSALWPLSFGVLAPSGASGSATMIVSDIADGSFGQAYYHRTPAASGGVTALVNQEGSTAPGPAVLKVEGALCFNYAITLPNNILVQLTTSDVIAPPMTLDNFICNLGAAGQLKYGIGQQYFVVGGTLHVAAGQPAGSYAGSFPVSVDYN